MLAGIPKCPLQNLDIGYVNLAADTQKNDVIEYFALNI